MPCWTVQESQVSLKNPNAEILSRALTAIGFRVNSSEYSSRFKCSITADRFSDGVSVKVSLTGEVSVTSSSNGVNLDTLSNEVKRAYSAEVVRTAAKRFGWNVTAKSETKFQVKRRF